jgi:hypothetical protein
MFEVKHSSSGRPDLVNMAARHGEPAGWPPGGVPVRPCADGISFHLGAVLGMVAAGDGFGAAGQRWPAGNVTITV